MASSPPEAIRWEGGADGRLLIIEQTLLPHEEREVELATPEEVSDAIYRLAVRGAPAIGVAAAYGLHLAARRIGDDLPRDEFLARLDADLEALRRTRPTAVNLAWALDRARAVLEEAPAADPPAMKARLHAEALAIHEEDRQSCEAMAGHAADLVADGGTYLTHCNAGALATGGIGTAVGVFHRAARDGKKITVIADETRPLLQGARLTAWELHRGGIEVLVQCDSAAASLLVRGGVDGVFVGSDRIAGNGDVANKLGTLSVALAAHRGGVPFYVVAPASTFDLSLASGSEIPIEDRAPEEVTEGFGERTAPDGVGARNPAFDVTPADLVTAIVTDVGVIRPVNRDAVTELIAPVNPPR